MAHQTTVKPLPDNNGCRMHPEYNFTCGTCNGYFDKDGNPTKMSTTEDSIKPFPLPEPPPKGWGDTPFEDGMSYNEIKQAIKEQSGVSDTIIEDRLNKEGE